MLKTENVHTTFGFLSAHSNWSVESIDHLAQSIEDGPFQGKVQLELLVKSADISDGKILKGLFEF